ncbi:MAG: NADH-quinone oxidoreductase subunit K [Legionellaceae bacterium]
MITSSHYLILSMIILGIGMAGFVINRKNILVMLMSIELILLAVNINFIAFSYFLNQITGQIFVFFILAIAAAEAAIGLSILIVLYRNCSTIDADKLDTLKG